METINNYLENIFLSLPNTSEVEKAKKELSQMMEDKYHELKSEGKSENEAIGIVITEFGNIEELKEELGISGADHSSAEKSNDSNNKKAIHLVTMKEAVGYLDTTKKYSVNIAIGVMLCIFSPIVLCILNGISETMDYGIVESKANFIGITSLLLFVVVAVAIFIYTGMQMEKFEYLKKEVFQIEKETEFFIKEKSESVKSILAIKIIIGIIICIISVIPLFFVGLSFEENEMASIFGFCIVLFMVGIAMLFLIPAGMEKEVYHVLLQEEEYIESNKSSIMGAVSSAYWCIATAIYLGWSLLTMDWHFTWIVWPIAGVLFGAIAAICNAVEKNNSTEFRGR